MLSCRNNTFWLQSPMQLVCDWNVIPVNQMTFEQKMNSLSRLTIFIFIILILFGIKISLIFLAVSLLFIIIFYYSFRTKTDIKLQENFTLINKEMSANLNTKSIVANNLQNWPKPEITHQGVMNPHDYISCNHSTNLDGMTPIFENQVTALPQPALPTNRVQPAPVIVPTCPNGQQTLKGVFNNPNYTSNNQKLVGNANPRTKIAPVVIPRPQEETWKATNLVVRPQINSETAFDNYLSGYEVSTMCAPPTQLYTRKPHNRDANLQMSLIQDIYDQQYCQSNVQLPLTEPKKDYQEIIEHYENQKATQKDRSASNELKYGMDSEDKSKIDDNDDDPDDKRDFAPKSNKSKCKKNKPENFSTIYDGNVSYKYPYIITPQNQQQENSNLVTPIQPGSVNTACGYNPSQFIEADIPANLNVGPGVKNCQVADYNHHLHTQTIQPGVYTTNQVNEPINANMGISFTQQFEPTVTTDNNEGGVNFTEMDPNIIEPDLFSVKPPYIQTDPTEWNVTDPRFTGYGTSYRAYTDNQLGQTKFYYDDVNSVRMPNYIVRSEIDTQPFADHYGPIPGGNEFGNQNNPIIRGLANGAFLDNSLQFRTEMQQRLMRKANANAWQQRSAPLVKGGMGGMCSC